MARPVVECWCCGRHRPHHGRGLCLTCYSRWASRQFAGPGPGLERIPLAERAAGWLPVITTLSARAAGERIGVSARTVSRWRAALRETT